MPHKRKKKNNKKKGKKKTYKKATIPKAIREQCWIQVFGKEFEHKCYISWCENNINVFDFHVGHDKPESQGGTLDIANLKIQVFFVILQAHYSYHLSILAVQTLA